MDHRLIDARSREMHRRIAEKIQRDPSLLVVARANLARWRQTQSPRSMPYLDAWAAIIDRGPDAVIAMLLDPSEHGDAMRQAAPFAGVLSNTERWDILARFRNVARQDGAPSRDP